MEAIIPSNVQVWTTIIVDALLAGDDPVMATLREQFKYAVTSKVQYTGVGYYIDFEFTAPVPECSHSGLEIHDVWLEFENVTAPTMAILFVRESRIAFLEIVTLHDGLPENPILRGWKYTHPTYYSTGKEYDTSERDWDYIRSHWNHKP